METEWDVLFTETFERGFKKLPHEVVSKLEKHLDFLFSNPFASHPGATPLKNQGKSRAFRLRLGDYRVLYRVIKHLRQVILTAAGPRGGVYTKPVGNGSGSRPIKILFPPKPEGTPSKAAGGENKPGQQSGAPRPTGSVDIEEILIDPFELDFIGILPEHHQIILDCTSVSEIEALDLPSGVTERVIDYLTSPSQTHVGRLYTLGDGDGFASVAHSPLREFMVVPDPQQRMIINKPLDAGPILVRGGPGTGKTLIGLYRLKRVIEERTAESLFDDHEPDFKFMSYTNSLVNTSEALFGSIFANQGKVKIHFSTLDKIVMEELTRHFGSKLGDPLDSGTLAFRLKNLTVGKMVRSGSGEESRAALFIEEKLGIEFLAEEITSVIEGNDIKTLEEYLGVQRRGRKTALQKPIREALWLVYSRFRDLCDGDLKYTWAGMRQKLLHLLEKDRVTMRQYDSLVLDEAQDMSVVALRLVIRFVRDPRFLLLLGDTGQSIYNKSPTWKNVSPDLRFHRGNSIILSKSYRMTKQLSKALLPLRSDADLDSDDPISMTSGVFDGDPPVWITAEDKTHVDEVGNIVSKIVEEQGVNPGQIAVIVRSVAHNNSQTHSIIKTIKELGLKIDVFDKKKPIDIHGDSVHLINAHSAKGLEFPFVIVPFVSDDQYPYAPRAPEGEKEIEEWEDEEQRLFYVALSRAGYRLWMVADSKNPSRFLSKLKPENWMGA